MHGGIEILCEELKTEVDYWKAIEDLGGMTFVMEHGRCKRKNNLMAKALTERKDTIERLVQEVCNKFGVIHPKDCSQAFLGGGLPPAPAGKIYYWDWYNRVKDLALADDWNRILCSACPFNTGFEDFKRGAVHCRLMTSTIFCRFDSRPLCRCILDKKFSHRQLEKKIFDEAGQEVLDAYKSRLHKLAADWQKEYGKPFRVWFGTPRNWQNLEVII